jgi:hypothetical protein
MAQATAPPWRQHILCTHPEGPPNVTHLPAESILVLIVVPIVVDPHLRPDLRRLRSRPILAKRYGLASKDWDDDRERRRSRRGSRQRSSRDEATTLVIVPSAIQRYIAFDFISVARLSEPRHPEEQLGERLYLSA